MTEASSVAFDAVALGTAIQRRIGVKTSRDEPLARFTTMRVGGPADLFATVHNIHELRAIVRFARSRGVPITILGRGSDVVISDHDLGRGVSGAEVLDRARRQACASWCVLLVGAGLLLHSFLRVLDVDLGFEPSRRAAIKVEYPEGDGNKRGVVLSAE